MRLLFSRSVPLLSTRLRAGQAAPLLLSLVFFLGCGASEEAGTKSGTVEDTSQATDATHLDIEDSAQGDTLQSKVDGGFLPAQEVFDPLGIHDIEIELLATSWEAILANAKDTKLTRVYHTATVTMDGERYENVGVKNFGDGSQQEYPAKPNARIKFNAFETKKRGPEKLRNLRLKASGGDPSFVREPLFNDMLREIGVVAPRYSFARVTVNGQPYGLYLILEQTDKRLFKRFFHNTDGLNYDVLHPCVGWNCPKGGCDTIDKDYEAKNDLAPGETPDFSPLQKLAAIVAQAPEETLLSKVGEIVDLDNLLKVYAMEAMASELDGFLAGGANFELYQDTKSKKLHIIRGGADSTFSAVYKLNKPWGPPNTWCKDRHDVLYERIMTIPSAKAKLYAHMREIQCGPFAKTWFLPWLDKLRLHLFAELKHSPKTLYTAADAVDELGVVAAYLVTRGQSAKTLLGPCP